MKPVFFLIVLSIFVLINSYLISRTWHVLSAHTVALPIVAGLLITLCVCLCIGMIFGPRMPHTPGKWLSHAGYTYLPVFLYLSISFLVVDLIRIANYFIGFAPSGLAQFRLQALIISAVCIVIALIVGSWKFNHPKIVTLELKVATPSQHKNLRIVAASDIHLGVTIDKDYLKSYVKLINAQNPDVVLLAGDIADRSILPLERQKMDEELRQIVAPLGVFAVLGNHEHFSENTERIVAFLEKGHIQVLRDEVAEVNGSFYLIGRDDRINRNRKTLEELVKPLNPGLPRILLDHQPYHLYEASQNHIDLQLSGHTHEGQFFPGNLIVRKIYELGYGYLKKGNTHIYVSSGLGIWGPQYRIGTQSELVVINLEL